MEIQDAKQARPHCELIAELLDSRQPKTEREHAAVREIERLRHDIERHIAIASEHATECERLRAEIAECRAEIAQIKYGPQGRGGVMGFDKFPWSISEYKYGRDAIVIDADGFGVAKVCYPNRDANARLIAAAPQLYAALVNVAAIARRYLEGYDEHPAIQDADAALALARKGEGEG